MKENLVRSLKSSNIGYGFVLERVIVWKYYVMLAFFFRFFFLLEKKKLINMNIYLSLS